MRELPLAVLALASAFLPNIASHAESVHVIGCQLSSSGPPHYFHPNRVNIVITNLPDGFPVGAGRCRTLTYEAAPKIVYNFSDGLTTGTKLTAAGYILDGRQRGRPAFPGKTYIKLCRDRTGNPAAFTVELTYYKFVSNVIQAYSVYAENDGAGRGKSSVTQSALFEGSAGTSATAPSNVVNRIRVEQ